MAALISGPLVAAMTKLKLFVAEIPSVILCATVAAVITSRACTSLGTRASMPEIDPYQRAPIRTGALVWTLRKCEQTGRIVGGWGAGLTNRPIAMGRAPGLLAQAQFRSLAGRGDSGVRCLPMLACAPPPSASPRPRQWGPLPMRAASLETATLRATPHGQGQPIQAQLFSVRFDVANDVPSTELNSGHCRDG